MRPVPSVVGRSRIRATGVQFSSLPECGSDPSASRRYQPSLEAVLQSLSSGSPPASVTVVVIVVFVLVLVFIVVRYHSDVRVGRPQHGRGHVSRSGALHSDAESVAMPSGQICALCVQIGRKLLQEFLNIYYVMSVKVEQWRHFGGDKMGNLPLFDFKSVA